jgi:hypothetical protein
MGLRARAGAPAVAADAPALSPHPLPPHPPPPPTPTPTTAAPQGLRAFLDSKCAAAAAGMARQKSAVAAGGSAEGMLRGNVGTITIDDKMLTPQMRLALYNNCSVLQPPQLKKFRDLVRQLCPTALEDLQNGEVKIDLDAFDFRTFIRIDTFVRTQSLQVPPPPGVPAS